MARRMRASLSKRWARSMNGALSGRVRDNILTTADGIRRSFTGASRRESPRNDAEVRASRGPCQGSIPPSSTDVVAHDEGLDFPYESRGVGVFVVSGSRRAGGSIVRAQPSPLRCRSP